MLRLASKQEQYSPILNKTAGIIFFSTPHLGSDIATNTSALHSIFRSSSVVDLLNPENLHLTKLHQQFKKIAPHISTLSFGENDKFCIVWRKKKIP